ncbi:MAG: DUF4340 domain-containing protein [Ruminococcaceae bacterium]|nr:DUF4340 domain-containing protein [Oscillospiraceae bacterium]
MKQRTKLLILAAILVVGIGGYFLVSALTAEPETTPEGDTSGTAILPFASSDIATLRWQFSDVDLTVAQNDSVWTYPAEPGFPLEQNTPYTMAASLATAQAVQTLTEPDDMAEYGLDDPAFTITATTTGGETYVMTIGDYSNFSEAYYMQVNGDTTKLYLVSEDLPKAFAYTLNDMIQYETLPGITYIQQVDIATDDHTLQLNRRDDGATFSYTDKYIWFTDVDGTLKPLDANKVSTLYSLVTDVDWLGCMTYKATEADLAAYGMDAPRATITLNYENRATVDTGETDASGNTITREEVTPATFTLLIGGTSGDGYPYAMIEGSSMVYIIAPETADGLIGASYETLRPDDVCPLNWDTLTAFDLRLDDAINVVTIEAGDEGNRYTSNGKELDADAVQSLLNSLNSMTAAGTLGSPNQSEAAGAEDASTEPAADDTSASAVASGTSTPEDSSMPDNTAPEDADIPGDSANEIPTQGVSPIEFTFYRNTDAYTEISLAFIPYGSEHYLVSFADEAYLLVSASDVDTLMANAEALFA